MDIFSLLSPNFETTLQVRVKSSNAYDARVATLLLEFIEALRREPPGPRLHVWPLFGNDLRLQYLSNQMNSCFVTVTLDRPDYGPLENGLPKFHYRISYQLMNRSKSEFLGNVEIRARSIQEATDFIHQAIQATNELP